MAKLNLEAIVINPFVGRVGFLQCVPEKKTATLRV